MQKTVTLDINKLLVYLAVGLVGFGLGVVQPFINRSTAERSVSVEGTAVISAAPDKFTFSPSFEAKGETQKAARESVEKKGSSAVTKLKELGVAEASIKTDLSVYEDYTFLREGSEPDGYVATYSITIEVDNGDLAQSVYDYLLGTDAVGQTSPYSEFSEAKQQELKQQARVAAVENAKTQAEQIAGELDGRLGSALSVEEVSGFDFAIPYFSGRDGIATLEDTAQPATFQPGEQDLRFTVKAVFELR